MLRVVFVVVLVRRENYERIGGKKRNTSKERYLEAKKGKAERKTFEAWCGRMIRNVMCWRLQRGWSKLIRILLVSSADGVLAVSDEDWNKKIAWKIHYKKRWHDHRPIKSDYITRSCSGRMGTKYKGKSNSLERGNCRGLNRSDFENSWKNVDKLITQQVNLCEMQFGLMPECGTINAIFILRQLQDSKFKYQTCATQEADIAEDCQGIELNG